MTDWLHYWKAPQVRNALADGILAHIASNQFGRVRAGDRIWVVNATDEGELVTIGYVDATEPVTMDEARARLDYEPWEANHHVLVDPDLAQRPRLVYLTEVAERLRFESTTSDRLLLTNGRVNGQQLQAMRRLTPASASMIQRAWDEGVEGQDAEYRRIDQALVDLGELDARREVLVRTEQHFLRRHLFGADGVGACGLCGRQFPASLLVAAHVKRRADCSDVERRDYASNVVPMCVFGCDALFERGILAVDGRGQIRWGRRFKLTESAEAYARDLVGERCPIWNPQNAPYFQWHAEQAREAAA